jgi:hypothetical protein
MQPLFKTLLGAGSFIAGLLLSTQAAHARYETCYKQEYRCETRYEQECNYVPQCHMVGGGQQCHQEQVCNTVPSHQNCQMVTECGTNALGQQQCKTRPVCTGGGGGGQSCHYEQRCNTTPAQQVCNNEYRCQQVPRQHCGYEQVASQCYVPDPVYPPAPNYPPSPNYPPAPNYPPSPNYPPAPNYPPSPDYPDYPDDEDGSYVPEEIGPQSITGLKLKILADNTAQVVFVDEGQDPDTEYVLVVRDESGEVVVRDRVQANGHASQKITLTEKLSLGEDHTLRLRVLREGGRYKFVKTFFRPGPGH